MKGRRPVWELADELERELVRYEESRSVQTSRRAQIAITVLFLNNREQILEALNRKRGESPLRHELRMVAAECDRVAMRARLALEKET